MPEAENTIEEPAKAVKRRKFTDEELKEKARVRARAWNAVNTERRKVSRRAQHEANRERNNARSKAYREANREKCKADTKAWCEANREKYRASKRAYYEANKERLSCAANKEKHKIWRKGYDKAHPEIASANNAKRRARKLAAPIGDIAAITAWQINWRKRKRVKCHWCRNQFPPKRCHADHAMPISKGGAHSLENLVVSCAHCNLSKRAQLPHEWNRQLAEPVLALM